MSDYVVEATRKRVRNVNLRVRRDGTVAVSAPARMPWSEIERIVREREGWIDARRAEVLAASVPHAWGDDDRVTVWGEPCELSVLADATRGQERAERVGGVVAMHVTSDHAGTDEEARGHRARLFDALLATEIERELSSLLPECEARVGKRASAIRLRRMTSRWGSCNVRTGRVTLNLELAERPRPCLEAVLCHELCHLHERGHNQRFYAHLDQACPAWRETRALLARPPRASR